MLCWVVWRRRNGACAWLSGGGVSTVACRRRATATPASPMGYAARGPQVLWYVPRLPESLLWIGRARIVPTSAAMASFGAKNAPNLAHASSICTSGALLSRYRAQIAGLGPPGKTTLMALFPQRHCTHLIAQAGEVRRQDRWRHDDVVLAVTIDPASVPTRTI